MCMFYLSIWMYALLDMVYYCTLLQNLEKESLNKLLSSGYKLLDVRTAGEHANNSAKVAMNVPLANIEEYIDKLDKLATYN